MTTIPTPLELCESINFSEVTEKYGQRIRDVCRKHIHNLLDPDHYRKDAKQKREERSIPVDSPSDGLRVILLLEIHGWDANYNVEYGAVFLDRVSGFPRLAKSSDHSGVWKNPVR